jgi:hypothetical protein
VGRAFVILPAATFIVGVLLGGGLVWLALDGGSADGDGSTAPEPAPSTSTPAPSVPSDAIVVPGACTRAARGAGTTVSLLRDALTAITDLDAARLEDVLDELEVVDQQIREDLAECRRLATSDAP